MSLNRNVQYFTSFLYYSTVIEEISPNNIVDWVIWSNFRNLTVKVWANLDNSFKRNDYAKFCIYMSASLDGNLPEVCDAIREQLSIAFVHIFFRICYYFFLDINSPVDQVQS